MWMGLVWSIGTGAAFAERPLVAILQSGEGSLYEQALSGLTGELTQRGYRAGVNIEYLTLTLNPRPREDPVEAILRRQPKVIVAVGTDATRALQQHYRQLPPERQPPVVFLMVLDPVAEGLIESAKFSGTRFAGVALTVRPQRQFQLLQDLAPGIRRIGALYNPDDATSRRLIEQAREDTRPHGLELIALEARTAQDIPRALSDLAGKIDALWLIPDPVCAAPQPFEQIAAFAIQHKLPLIAFAETYVKRGALVAVGVDFTDQGVAAAELVDQLLHGADPAAMPLLTPRRLRTAYNLKIAHQLGITIPSTLLNLADRVYEQ